MRISELKRRVAVKRVELVNAYFLESAINPSGGEALVRQGVMGLRWYQKMFGLKPRHSWNVDICGTHDQMRNSRPDLASKSSSTRAATRQARRSTGPSRPMVPAL
ncbi:MAG TPA: hypothetical protein VFA90_17685 [Terriglobales bacterium]|nr:hypothetical protein [Terriglobales bacterium]